MKTKVKYTALHRLLHWVMAFAMPVLYLTGFLRMQWMSKKSVAEALASQNLDVTKEQARGVYKSLASPMWQWHEVFAHVMIFAFLARIIYMISKGIRFPNPFNKQCSTKERLQGFIYFYFYVFLAVSAFTGVCIEKDLLSNHHETIESIHKWGIYWFPIFVCLHFIGIFIAETSNKKGIASNMIGGEK
ncbi:MAG: cytochrome b/b6 domain-containing protein [Bacteroidia bacterium]|nr:cytochrome b/b6 domain-containing protein [Bacteroidia bacterium]